MPKVSIIMPVYNVEKYVRASIESVLAQTYDDYELIIVDDGSPDTSPQICDEYSERYENIHVIHKKNGGLSSARNMGIENATGKYILFIDSDDTISNDLLEKIVPIADSTGADVTVFGITTCAFENGKKIAEKKGEHLPKLYLGKDSLEENFVYLTQNSMWNHPIDKLYLRDTIVVNHVLSNSFYDRVCEDTCFLLDLFPYVNKVCVAEGCYYNYFIRDTQSVVAKFIPDRYEKYYGRFCKTQDLMKNFKTKNYNEKFLYELYCTFIIWAYEFMFHKDCTYSFYQRYVYIKKIFSIRSESARFSENAIKYIKTQEIYLNSSRTTQKVLISILKNNYIKAWIYHMIAYLRR